MFGDSLQRQISETLLSSCGYTEIRQYSTAAVFGPGLSKSFLHMNISAHASQYHYLYLGVCEIPSPNNMHPCSFSFQQIKFV